MPEDLPKGQVAVAAFRRRRTAEEHALVVLSMKLPYWLHPHAGRFYLCVPEDSAEAAAAQLEKYRSERRRWPPKALAGGQSAPANPWACSVYAVLMIAFYVGQQQLPGLTEEGLLNTLKLFDADQWWRPITALTLHADLGHLAGNMLSGICFGLLLSSRFGYGLGWLLLLLSGIIGNALNAWGYYPNQHLSLGASTALFGGLGILVGSAMIQSLTQRAKGSWKRTLLPLMGGVTMLGLTGLGQENTDVMAHVFGFASGLGLGLVASWLLGNQLLGKRWQALCATLTLATVAIAWLAATTY